MTAVNYGFGTLSYEPRSKSVVDPVAAQDTMLCARGTWAGHTLLLCDTGTVTICGVPDALAEWC
jgi:hypothetical protein